MEKLFSFLSFSLKSQLRSNCITANKGNQDVNLNRAVRFIAFKVSVHPRSDAQGMYVSESQMNFVHIPLMRHYRTFLSSNLYTSQQSPTPSRSLNMTGKVLFCFLTQRAWRDRYTTFCTVGWNKSYQHSYTWPKNSFSSQNPQMAGVVSWHPEPIHQFSLKTVHAPSFASVSTPSPIDFSQSRPFPCALHFHSSVIFSTGPLLTDFYSSGGMYKRRRRMGRKREKLIHALQSFVYWFLFDALPKKTSGSSKPRRSFLIRATVVVVVVDQEAVLLDWEHLCGFFCSGYDMAVKNLMHHNIYTCNGYLPWLQYLL